MANAYRQCPDCDGTGIIKVWPNRIETSGPTMERCATCEGTGWVKVPWWLNTERERGET